MRTRTKLVRAETRRVRAQTKSVRPRTRFVRTQTESVRARTKPVRARTRLVRAQTESVRARTRPVRTQTRLVFAAPCGAILTTIFRPPAPATGKSCFKPLEHSWLRCRLMIFINIMKIVSNALENHNGMGEIGPDTTTNGGKSRLGLHGMAFCRLSVNWLVW